MSSFDIFVRNNVVYPILPLLLFIIVLYFGKGYITKLRKRTFAYFLNALTWEYNTATDEIKNDLFANLKDISSEDWKLKNEGLIRILEIGIGTGANLKYYPKGCRLVAVDWNEEMKPLFMENCKKYPHVNVENFLVAQAEDMSDIGDNSVDVVVCTLLLCSADNVQKILEEVRRVLVPGGKFLFLEHVHAEPGTVISKIQSFLSVSKIWPLLFLGCELNRHTGEVIDKSGFSAATIKRIEVNLRRFSFLKFIKSHIVGCAVK